MPHAPQLVRIAILGATGRMGRSLIESVLESPQLQLVAAVTQAGEAAVGSDAGTLVGRPGIGVAIATELAPAVQLADVVIDFTRPQGTETALRECVAAGKSLVIGTTGFNAQQKAAIADAAKSIPICLAANFSIGVNVSLKLIADAARTLGAGYDVEILEAHHRHKVDAPSGTALRMGEAAAAGLGIKLEDCAVYAREGITGARATGAIGFASVRGGDVVGDHTVMFLGDGERIEISHKASSRGNFARGALRAAAWLSGRGPGLYDMQDVLGLK
ncbi:MAG: 4-hydroxy-tetrahydrodipicolinate reductase [Nevskia sp.]|nr:4-hydroxy-tetrahydrodipicolinate reductase [Nevskia sp.]